jgi:PilZ domain
MDFIREDAIILGTCYDLSQSGLRGTFVQVIAPGSKGVVTLYLGERRLEVEATVSSIRDDETRMRFHFDSDKQRTAIREVLKEIAALAGK